MVSAIKMWGFDAFLYITFYKCIWVLDCRDWSFFSFLFIFNQYLMFYRSNNQLLENKTSARQFDKQEEILMCCSSHNSAMLQTQRQHANSTQRGLGQSTFHPKIFLLLGCSVVHWATALLTHNIIHIVYLLCCIIIHYCEFISYISDS